MNLLFRAFRPDASLSDASAGKAPPTGGDAHVSGEVQTPGTGLQHAPSSWLEALLQGQVTKAQMQDVTSAQPLGAPVEGTDVPATGLPPVGVTKQLENAFVSGDLSLATSPVNSAGPQAPASPVALANKAASGEFNKILGAGPQQVVDRIQNAARDFGGEIKDTPVIAFLTGHLEKVEPESIPEIVGENDFVNGALTDESVIGFLQQPLPLGRLIDALDLGSDFAAAMERLGVPLTTEISPSQFLQSLGIDTQRVFAELQILRDAIPVTGIIKYIERASELQNVGALADDQAHPTKAAPGVASFPSQKDGHYLEVPVTTEAGTPLESRDRHAAATDSATVVTASKVAKSLADLQMQAPHRSADERLGGPLPGPHNLAAAKEQIAAPPMGKGSDHLVDPRPALHAKSATSDPFTAMQSRMSQTVGVTTAAAEAAEQPADMTNRPQANAPTTLQQMVRTQVEGSHISSLANHDSESWSHPTFRQPVANGMNVAEGHHIAQTAGAKTGNLANAQALGQLADEVVGTSGNNGVNGISGNNGASEAHGINGQPPANPKLTGGGHTGIRTLAEPGIAATASNLLGNSSSGNSSALATSAFSVDELAFRFSQDGGSREFSGGTDDGFTRDGSAQEFSGGSWGRLDATITKASERLGQTARASFGAELGEVSTAERAAAIQKIIDQSVMLSRAGGGSMKVDLNHSQLGPVELAMSLSDDRVDLRLLTQSEQVRDILANDLNKLRDSLSDQNLRLGTVEVGVDSQSGRDSGRHSDGGQQFARQPWQEQWQQGFSDQPDGRSFAQQVEEQADSWSDLKSNIAAARSLTQKIPVSQKAYEGGRIAVMA